MLFFKYAVYSWYVEERSGRYGHSSDSQSVIGEIQLDIPSIEVQKLVVEMDQLRRESECIRSEINELKQSLQDQLLMDSLK